MSSIIYIDDVKNKRKLAKEKQTSLLRFAVDAVYTQWDSHMRKGTINEYISKVLKIGKKDYINDLKTLSDLEKKLGISVSVFGPGCLFDTQIGFTAGFKIGDDTFSTPEMLTEAYARAFNLLLFIEVMDCKKLNDKTKNEKEFQDE